MPADTPATLLTVGDSVATSQHRRSAVTAAAEDAQRRRRARGARWCARDRALKAESVSAASAERHGAQGGSHDSETVTSAKFTVAVVPSLKGVVDAAAWSQLVEGSPSLRTAAGELIYPFVTRPAILAIVRGVARVRTRKHGRGEGTTRYARVGDAIRISVARCCGTGESWTEAVTDTTIAVLPRRRLRALAAENTRLAGLIGKHLGAPQPDAHRPTTAPERASITSRIAGHLLEMTTRTAEDDTRVGVSVGRLATTTGTARAAVSRSLGRLRRAGVLETRAGPVVIADRKRLSRIARGSEQIP